MGYGIVIAQERNFLQSMAQFSDKEKKGVFPMDDTQMQSLERLLQAKIMLYNELLHCLERERESLITIDLDKLWAISRQKEEICARIRSVRREIIAAVSPGEEEKFFTLNRIFNVIPAKETSKLQKLHLALVKLGGEIEALRKENMLFIDDSLQFLDEMISIIAGETRSRDIYDDKCHVSKSGAGMLLSREA
jgi:hypothetical protein